jgi:hypothetical protein
MTPSGIEPATCRFVAQCLNHYRAPRKNIYIFSKNFTSLYYLGPIVRDCDITVHLGSPQRPAVDIIGDLRVVECAKVQDYFELSM